MRAEINELRESETLHRLKAQKLAEEMRDFKDEMENLRARNAQLESRSKRYNICALLLAGAVLGSIAK